MKVIRLHKKTLDDYIDELRQGKRAAQHEVYNLLSGKMLSVCRQYISDIHYAEDVMVTGFMKVFTSVGKYENRGSFEGWIRRIMINESISFLRSRKELSYIEDEKITQSEVEDIESDLSVEDIQLLIDNLPEGCRTIFNLYAVEGYKHQEIAELLRIKEGTSKSQLAQARKLLQQQLQNLQQRGIWSGIK